MKKGIMAAIVAGVLVAAPVNMAKAGEGAVAYGEAIKLLGDSMLKFMAATFLLYNDMTVPLWGTVADVIGVYGGLCKTCHQPLSNVYRRIGKALDPDIHREIAEEELQKALEAYLQQRAETVEPGTAEEQEATGQSLPEQ